MYLSSDLGFVQRKLKTYTAFIYNPMSKFLWEKKWSKYITSTIKSVKRISTFSNLIKM